MRASKYFIIGGLTSLGIILSTTVFGYVLAPEMVLSLMTKELGRSTRPIVVSQSVGIDAAECQKGQDNYGLQETVWYNPPGQFRAETISGSAKKIYIVSNGQNLTILNQKILSTAESRLMLYKELLLFKKRESLATRLTALGVDMTLVSLGHSDGRVAYVIGADYPDETVSQLWVDKEEWLPWRLIIRDVTKEGQPEEIEIIYSDWRKTNSRQYPGRIEIHQNQSLRRVICAHDIATAGRLADNFFDISYLKSKYTATDQTSGLATKEKEVDEVEQTINDFTKLYR